MTVWAFHCLFHGLIGWSEKRQRWCHFSLHGFGLFVIQTWDVSVLEMTKALLGWASVSVGVGKARIETELTRISSFKCSCLWRAVSENIDAMMQLLFSWNHHGAALRLNIVLHHNYCHLLIYLLLYCPPDVSLGKFVSKAYIMRNSKALFAVYICCELLLLWAQPAYSFLSSYVALFGDLPSHRGASILNELARW